MRRFVLIVLSLLAALFATSALAWIPFPPPPHLAANYCANGTSNVDDCEDCAQIGYDVGLWTAAEATDAVTYCHIRHCRWDFDEEEQRLIFSCTHRCADPPC
jgi:hypothetical protein